MTTAAMKTIQRRTVRARAFGLPLSVSIICLPIGGFCGAGGRGPWQPYSGCLAGSLIAAAPARCKSSPAVTKL